MVISWNLVASRDRRSSGKHQEGKAVLNQVADTTKYSEFCFYRQNQIFK